MCPAGAYLACTSLVISSRSTCFTPAIRGLPLLATFLPARRYHHNIAPWRCQSCICRHLDSTTITDCTATGTAAPFAPAGTPFCYSLAPPDHYIHRPSPQTPHHYRNQINNNAGGLSSARPSALLFPINPFPHLLAPISGKRTHLLPFLRALSTLLFHPRCPHKLQPVSGHPEDGIRNQRNGGYRNSQPPFLCHWRFWAGISPSGCHLKACMHGHHACEPTWLTCMQACKANILQARMANMHASMHACMLS